MDNYNNEVNNLPTKMKKPKNWNSVWVFVIILLLLVGVVAVIYFVNIKEEIDEISNPAVGVHDDGLPNEIYAYSGEIVMIENNILKINISKSDNYTLSDKELMVTVNENTKYRKFIVPDSIPELTPGESGSYYERVDITLADIKIGNQVTIIADENIKNKTEFNAAIIEVHGE